MTIFAFLFFIFINTLQAQDCENLHKLKVKPFPINDVLLLKGPWYVHGFLDNENGVHNGTQYLSFFYDPDPYGMYINVTKHEHFCNNTSIIVKQRIVFINTYEIKYYFHLENPNGLVYTFKLIDWDLTNSKIENQFLTYYSCSKYADGSSRNLFSLLTREYCRGPNAYVRNKEFDSLLKIKDRNLRGNLKVFAHICSK